MSIKCSDKIVTLLTKTVVIKNVGNNWVLRNNSHKSHSVTTYH